MINKETARSIAQSHITSHYQAPGDEIIIIDDKTIERDWGWIFFYQGKNWLKTNDKRYKILGLYPIVIEKKDSSLHYLNGGKSIEECIKEYEIRRKLV